MPGAHQVTTGVLTGTDQIPGSLLIRSRNRHRGELVQAQQPGQMDRVLGVGLHPVAAGSLQFRRGHDLAPDPALTWTGLTIVGSGEDWVEFVAAYERDGRPGEMREHSVFERRGGRWVYVSGRPS